ncbi:MAG: transglycosylase SLT domain-containing protein [Alistipes sp.]
MFKKTILIFTFLAIITTFYGFNANFTTTVDDAFALETDDHSLLPSGAYVISAYDNIIRSVSEKEGHDWRLMSAIAYHESRFTPDIVSHRGARGLMQIMPAVARRFNVEGDQMIDPATNVWLAGQVINSIAKTFRFPKSVSEQDRMSIILASYNSGVGHVGDARRLAQLHGEDPNSWAVVSRYLQLKADAEYYNKEVVKCGQFTGSRQTLAFVDDVIGRYNKYCRIASL